MRAFENVKGESDGVPIKSDWRTQFGVWTKKIARKITRQ